MKKLFLSLILFATVLSACGKNEISNEDAKKVQSESQNESESQIESPSLSNMASDESLSFVEDALKTALASDNDPAAASVDRFIAMVKDYNKTVGEDNLIGDFSEDLHPIYDVGKLIENRDKADKKFPDTNCRINSYLLAADNMKVQKAGDSDDKMLFMDEEKIKEGKIFDDERMETFKKFFGRVPTEDSKDPAVHGKVMEEYLKDWSYPDKASLISVVINDKLDGNYLFIGHIGVLVPIDGGYLFVEKISFEEPYQAIKLRIKTKSTSISKTNTKTIKTQIQPLHLSWIMENLPARRIYEYRNKKRLYSRNG